MSPFSLEVHRHAHIALHARQPCLKLSQSNCFHRQGTSSMHAFSLGYRNGPEATVHVMYSATAQTMHLLSRAHKGNGFVFDEGLQPIHQQWPTLIKHKLQLHSLSLQVLRHCFSAQPAAHLLIVPKRQVQRPLRLKAAGAGDSSSMRPSPFPKSMLGQEMHYAKPRCQYTSMSLLRRVEQNFCRESMAQRQSHSL